jgi:hypothetical protein
MRIRETRLGGGEGYGSGFFMETQVRDIPDDSTIPPDAIKVTDKIPLTNGWIRVQDEKPAEVNGG